MNYSKPEVKTLGEAIVVIEVMNIKMQPRFLDFFFFFALLPAYDLDE